MGHIKEVEAAWLAGIFDGEGNVQHRADRGHLAIRLRIGMTCCTTMLRVSDLLDQAEITAPWYEQVLPSGKITFTVEVGARAEIRKFAALVAPYSITKRGEIEAAVAALDLIDASKPHEAISQIREAIPPRYRKRV